MKAAAKQIGAILLVSGILAALSSQLHPRRIPWIQDWSRQVEAEAQERDIDMVSLSGALDLIALGKAVFIDARPRSSFAAGHIPGAVSIPFEEFDQCFPRIVELIDSASALVVYCSNRTCDDALLLAGQIKNLGGDAALFVDGYESWLEHEGEAAR